MGTPNVIVRTCVRGDEVSTGCYWCGRRKARLYAYNRTGFFCDKDCAQSWHGENWEGIYIHPEPK